MISDRQTRGVAAVSIILAVIPFICFFYADRIDSEYPVFSLSGSDNLAIEIMDKEGASGLFFVRPGTTAGQLLASLDSKRILKQDFKLQNAMKMSLDAKSDHPALSVGKMDAAKRLSLGLPIDVNLAGRDELILIPGIGEKLAGHIVDYRSRAGRFETLDQLMEIKGIKEKKLAKLKQ
ncbi:MAG: DNA-binding protein, ComEA family [Deltaproteobacteria bacterium]|jgi:competence protein ComEA|nr:DNA-binding protein, ComEA family [Deltaproteobacteria bacterium]